MLMRSTVLVLCTAMLMLLGVSAHAQNESGRRTIDKAKFQQLGYWYDASTAMYQLQYPIIRSLPPISSGMPYDVLLPYIFADSIARFDSAQLAWKHAGRWTVMNDTLKGMATYIYKMTDYNPILFEQYINEVNLKRGTKYRTSLVNIIENVRKAMLKAVPSTDRAAVYSALYPDYILRVKVNRIDSMLGKPNPSSLSPYRFQVTASVLDTLKGKVFSTCNDQWIAKNQGSGQPIVLADGANPCIHFQYTHGNYFFPSELIGWIYQKNDETFSVGGGFAMQVGQEAVVFLSHYGQKYDSTNDYFDLDLEPQASYNALPIINGQVQDINHVWSPNTLTPYEDWKAKFMAVREKILTGNY